MRKSWSRKRATSWKCMLKDKPGDAMSRFISCSWPRLGHWLDEYVVTYRRQQDDNAYLLALAKTQDAHVQACFRREMPAQGVRGS